MIVTADQIVAHLVGDYILQSDWMAAEKLRSSFAAAVHAVFYSLPFLFLRPSLIAWAVIVITHFVIDRWRLARYVCWLKNWIGPHGYFPFGGCRTTGYVETRPDWLTVWLMIIADNTMHLLCSAAAFKWL